MLQSASAEQRVAIQHILNGDNVVLDAVAGSGKSTTVLAAASVLPDKHILLLAFNAILRKETESKIKKMNLTNVAVHTFHSLCVKYYLESAHTDTGIRRVILGNMPPRKPLPRFDLVVLDEAQDMSFLYFQWMAKFIHDAGRPFQLFVLGDYMQGLYEFKGADIRALTMADHIWRGHPLLVSPVFHKCTLQTSYRITRPMAAFVNEVMLGHPRLVAQKEGANVMYIRNSRRNIEIVVLSQINTLLAAGESPGDIFVLGASVKGVNSNIRKMENALVDRGVPCYVPMFDTEHIDDKIVDGKVVFSTFHSVKGRERKYVFVMGFDQSYFKSFAKKCTGDTCPNTLYVGCTRATHCMYLLENDQYSTDRPFEFLKMSHREIAATEYTQFRGTPREIFYERAAIAAESGEKACAEKFHEITPTDLVKFVPDHVLEQISELIESMFLTLSAANPDTEIQIPRIVQTFSGQFEDVCDLNGIAIPSIYYDHLCRKFTTADDASPVGGAAVLREIIDEVLATTREGECTFLKQLTLPDPCASPGDYLLLANAFVAAKEKLMFKLKQIHPADYTWLSPEIVRECLDSLDAAIGDECDAAMPLIEHAICNRDDLGELARINSVLSPHFPPDEMRFRFSARTDMITPKSIWEIKCTSSLSVEHKLQLVLYDWLWRTTHCESPASRRPAFSDPRECKLFNVRTGECFRLNATYADLTTVVVALLKGKYAEPETMTDAEFRENCRETIANLNGP